MQYFGWAEKVNVLADGKGFDSDGLETIYAKLDTEAKQEYEFSKEEVSSLSIETEEKMPFIWNLRRMQMQVQLR